VAPVLPPEDDGFVDDDEGEVPALEKVVWDVEGLGEEILNVGSVDGEVIVGFSSWLLDEGFTNSSANESILDAASAARDLNGCIRSATR
jgi:hypothetical protein